MATDLAFLNDLDDFEPSNLPVKPDALIDGNYEMVFRTAKNSVNPTKGAFIIATELEILSAGKHMGQRVKIDHWIKDGDSRDRVIKMLIILGFDCDQWTKANNRAFSKEIQNVYKVLPGMRVKAKKATNDGVDVDGKKVTYHNLYINERLLTDGKPARIGPDLLHAADEADPFPDVPFAAGQ